VLVAAPLAAAESADKSAPRVMQAHALEFEPILDGVVALDPAWQKVVATSEFWQTRPFAGKPSSQATEVRIGFTETDLWIGVTCYDTEPGSIIVSDARRDASLRDADSFQMIFDPFEDRQNGFVFGTNAAGLEYDGQVSDEGGSFNLNWNGVWRVVSRIDEDGWSAEFRIPFTTLRYPAASVQNWGVNFQRIIRRDDEISYWAPLDQQFGLTRLSDAGTLEGIEAPARRNLQLMPYVLATARRASDRLDTADDFEVGLDVKYGVTPSLTLDATYNTDFAQVEADEQQINLDRFNLFFPEKRPFFLENSGLFSVGDAELVQLFFSRRIGIGPGGQPIPIDGGLRLSGKAGRTNVGLLAMRTGGVEDQVEANSFGVARVSRELPNRSSVGALVVAREGSGTSGENQTYAIDGRWGFGKYSSVGGYLARTHTPGRAGSDHAISLGYSLTSPRWRSAVSYLEVGENFNPEVGFLTRSGYRRPSLLLFRTVRPKNLWGFHELRPHVSYNGFWDFDGFQESGHLHLDTHWEWRSGYQVHTGFNATREGVKQAFEISPGVFVQPGTYDNTETQLVFSTDSGKPISFSTTTFFGGFFGGDRATVNSTLRLRRGEKLTSALTWSYNDVDLPEGAFETNLGRLRVSYSLTTRLVVETLLQYNDRTGRVSTNLRLSWLRQANTGLYVVYNEIQDFGERNPLARPDRSLIVKYSHLIDVFR
jgi:hypothetical protein